MEVGGSAWGGWLCADLAWPPQQQASQLMLGPEVPSFQTALPTLSPTLPSLPNPSDCHSKILGKLLHPSEPLFPIPKQKVITAPTPKHHGN